MNTFHILFFTIRYMLGLAGIPSVIMFFGCLILTESPRWLISKGHLDRARAVLIRIRGTDDVDEELESIRLNCEEEARIAQGRMVFMAKLHQLRWFY